MSVKAMTWVWTLKGIPAPTRLVLLALADWADDEGVAFPAVATVADKCELSIRTVQRHLRAAEQYGLLTTTQRSSSSLYKLPVHKVWGDKMTGVTELTDGGDRMTGGDDRLTGGGDSGDTQHITNTSLDTSSNTLSVKESAVQELTIKILTAINTLGQLTDAQTSSIATRFTRAYPDIPLEWIDEAREEISARNDVSNPLSYMQAMLRQWAQMGGSPSVRGKRKYPKRKRAKEDDNARSDEFYTEYTKRQAARGLKT